MLLPIYIYGSTVLRQTAQEITPEYPELDSFLTDLWETMYEADGVGLAAPQVGRSVRIFVVHLPPGAGEDEGAEGFQKTFINPQIYERLGPEEVFNEGCLSVPGIHEDVIRSTKIKIRYLDEQFNPHDEQYDGFAARVIQHEYDHLEGMMFVDRVNPLRKKLLKSKLLAMSKGKYTAHYPCKQIKK